MITRESDASDAPPDLPSIERTAYEYCVGCSFQALYSPDIELLVKMLQMHDDFVGFRDKIDNLSDIGRKEVVSTSFWNPFAKNIIIGVKVCITGEEKALIKMKKQLISMERLTIRQFASSHACLFSDGKLMVSEYQALLNVLGTCVCIAVETRHV